MMYKKIIDEEYVKKDINNFINFMNNDEDWQVSVDGDDNPNEYHTKVAKIVRKLKTVTEVCQTRKIEKNRKDFKTLANDLKTIADLMIEVSNIKREKEAKTIGDKDLKELKSLLDKLFE